MHTEIGIELGKSEIDELTFVRSRGREDVDFDSPRDAFDIYASLGNHGLVEFYSEESEPYHSVVTCAWLTRRGEDWMAGYEASETAKIKQRRHDYAVVAAGAAAGGAVSIAVELIVHLLLLS